MTLVSHARVRVSESERTLRRKQPSAIEQRVQGSSTRRCLAEDKLEMLFVRPEARGQGIGKALVTHCVEHLGVRKVDVNEQNPQALGFYLRMGFKVKSRSALDSLGKPFPILHMELQV